MKTKETEQLLFEQSQWSHDNNNSYQTKVHLHEHIGELLAS